MINAKNSYKTPGAVFTKHFILLLGVLLTRAKTFYVGVFSSKLFTKPLRPTHTKAKILRVTRRCYGLR